MKTRASTAAVALALAAPPAFAQQGRFVPTIVVSQCYDDNVWSTSEDPETDYITRVIPAAEGSYKTPSFSVIGRYELEADFFSEHPTQSTVPAGQDVTAEMSFGPSPRVLFGARGGYTETRSASGLARIIGFDLGQVNARRLAAGTSLAWRLARRTRVLLTGDWDRDRLVGSEWGSTRMASGTLSHRLAKHTEASLGYTLRRFDFEAQPGLTAHVVTASLTRELGKTSQITVSGGPRLEPDQIEPEGAVWLQTRPGRADVTFGASRVGSRVLGYPGKWLPGAATTDSLAVELGYSPSTRLRFAVTPGYYHTRLDRGDRRQATVRRVIAEGGYRLKPWLALLTSYEWSLQQGDLSAEPGNVRHRIFMVRFATHWVDTSGRPPVIKKPGTGDPVGDDGIAIVDEEGVER